MNIYNQKDKSSPLTLDTYAASTLTFNHLNLQTPRSVQPDWQKHIFRFSQAFEDQQQLSHLFANRSNINLRERYIFKVLGHQENQNLPALKHQNIFIFDWDDTLICTSYLAQNKFVQLNEQKKKQIKQLDQISQKNLKFSIKKGFVFIITNAGRQWIQYSSKSYLPKTHYLISTSARIKILSARQLYQTTYPSNTTKWKIQTFKKIMQYQRKQILTNMICIGDSQDQMIASHLLAKQFKHIYLKRIKLQEKPDPEELIKQLKALEKKFQDIFNAIASTTIKLAKRMISPEKGLPQHSPKFDWKQ